MAAIFARTFHPSLRRKWFSLAEQSTKLRSCVLYSETKCSEPESCESTQFKAVVLNPQKKALAIETMVRTGKAEENMVRVGIEYCALNAFDATAVTLETERVTLPFIPGSQFSGEVLDIGPKCSKGLQLGDKIAVFGDTLNGGGLSQHCFVPETECIRMDTDKVKSDTGTILQGYANAMLAFTKYVSLEEGDDIIIIAGPGGDGLAAIEIATKVFKANVLAVFASKSVDALMRDEPLDLAINTDVGLTKVYSFIQQQDKKFKAVYDAYDSKLLHVVADFIPPTGQFLTIDPFFSAEKFDPPYFRRVSNTSIKAVKKAKAKAAKDEKSAKAKATSQEIEEAEASTWKERVKRVNISGYQLRDPEYYEQVIKDVCDLYATEKVEPLISQTFSLDETNKAINYLRQKKCLGNVLVKLKQK